MIHPTTVAARVDVAPRRHVGALALWIATLLPPVAVLLLVRVLAVNVPFEDDWDMVAVLTRWHAGTLTFADFWQQHSEHRIAALKALIWAVGAATDFSLTAEMYVGLALSAIKLTLLVDLIRRSVDVPPRWVAALIALASSLLMFSLVQHEDWFWGTASLQFGATNLCTVTLMWALSRSPDSWRALAVAALCAIVALFTEVSGHVLWITGAAAIWWFSSRARAVRRLLVWLAVAISVSSIYWWNLQFAASTSTIGLLEAPERFMVYAGALLGLPFAYWMTVPWAALVGYTALIPLGLCSWWLYTWHRERFDRLSPLLLFALHGALVCGLIAAGRSHGDPDSALTSHYSFAPNLYWVGVLAMTAAACSTWLGTATTWERRIALSLAGTVGVLLAVGYVRGNVVGYQKAYTRSRNLQMALVRLSSATEIPRPVLRFLYPPDEDRARSLVAQLRTLKLGPFTSGPQATAGALAERFATTAAGPDADGFLDGGDCIATTGWAWDPAHPDAPVALEVWSGDVLLGTVAADWFRWDLSAAGKGNGQHTFRFLFPTQGALRTGRQVRVMFAGTDRGLRGSPATVYCRH